MQIPGPFETGMNIKLLIHRNSFAKVLGVFSWDQEKNPPDLMVVAVLLHAESLGCMHALRYY
jgi:hypothetical protein